jgi:hypothetical protein
MDLTGPKKGFMMALICKALNSVLPSTLKYFTSNAASSISKARVPDAGGVVGDVVGDVAEAAGLVCASSGLINHPDGKAETKPSAAKMGSNLIDRLGLCTALLMD